MFAQIYDILMIRLSLTDQDDNIHIKDVFWYYHQRVTLSLSLTSYFEP